ncbi:hypothetical protein ACWGIU_38240, partial [Streptomyces sp. NPDC054840]
AFLAWVSTPSAMNIRPAGGSQMACPPYHPNPQWGCMTGGDWQPLAACAPAPAPPPAAYASPASTTRSQEPS